LDERPKSEEGIALVADIGETNKCNKKEKFRNIHSPNGISPLVAKNIIEQSIHSRDRSGSPCNSNLSPSNVLLKDINLATYRSIALTSLAEALQAPSVRSTYHSNCPAADKAVSRIK